MINERIPDSDIPGADPARVVAQYEPFVKKLAKRYIPILDRSGAVGLDDLYQAGRIAVLQAQKKYNPDEGSSFIHYLSFYIRSHIRRTLGFDNNGAAPARLVYLDEPLTDDEGNETARVDLIADPDILPFDEPMIDAETRNETAAEVHAALDRMKSDKQREIIRRVYLDGQTRQQAADETGAKIGAVYALDKEGRSTLRRDRRLKEYAQMIIPSFHVGVHTFRSTWTSAVERELIWKEEHLREPEEERSREEIERETEEKQLKKRLAYLRRMETLYAKKYSES